MFTWLMRVEARAKTHEQFPSHQEVPSCQLTCSSFKMGSIIKKKAFKNTDSGMFIFCSHVLSKLAHGFLEISNSSIKAIVGFKDF